jgi:hypothetical protein
VLVDFDAPSAQPLLVRLHLPAGFTGGSILRLIAPSPGSTSRVQLGGTEVASSGSWSPKAPLPRLYGSGGALSLELPASSAALVTLDAPAAH